MADLVVVFTKAIKSAPTVLIVPLEIGSETDTEVVSIGTSSDETTKVAADGRDIVDILAGADCWIAIGANPTAVEGSGRMMLEGERLQFTVSAGDKVAVIAA